VRRCRSATASRRAAARRHVAVAAKALNEFGPVDISKFSVVRPSAVAAPPDLHRQTRAGRRQQPGHSRRWSARSTSASWNSSARTIPTRIPIRAAQRTTQGILEFVEMFKAPIKNAPPLLTATQESNYGGTENIRWHSLSRHHSRPLERSGVADLQETTRTTRHSSTASASSRCRTACGSSRSARSTKAARDE